MLLDAVETQAVAVQVRIQWDRFEIKHVPAENRI